MDGFSHETPPEAYQKVQWIADISIVLMGAGWLVNYSTMIWHAFTEKTYGMALLPLFSNLGWEITYVLVYPSPNKYEFAVLASWLTLNVGIITTAARAAPLEWAHSPLVAQNPLTIFLVGTIVCFTGHVALAREIGSGLAYSWGAFICQLSLSVGGMCQLLSRNSTRGTSWMMWYSRFFGSSAALIFGSLRWWYWPEAFAWCGSSLMVWGISVFVVSEMTYGYCFYRVRQSESRERLVDKRE